MASSVDAGDGGERKSARSKRKAKEKANARKRAAAGNVVNSYAALEGDGNAEHEEDGQEAQPVQNAGAHGGDGTTADESRPKTSHSDASGETLVGAQESSSVVTPAPTPTPQNDTAADAEEPKTTSREWTYHELSDISTPDFFQHEQDANEPLTEVEIRHKEIEDWLLDQKGHHYSLKKSTVDKIVEFVYCMKYEEDRADWMKEVRLTVWRAAVRSNFWWTNPDTNTPTGKPEPISAPTGVYEQNFAIFVTCAAERLDRVGRDLPDPEYVQQIESALRLFFRRIAYKDLVRPLEHFAFLLMIDEEQNRFLTKEGLQTRLRMCFDRVKAMDWSGMGLVSMGKWPVRKTDPPLRQEIVWEDMVRRFRL